MELGEYFSEVFGKIFVGDIYWPTFVLALISSIVVGAIFAVIAFAIIGSALNSLFSTLMTSFGTQGSVTWASILAKLGVSLGALLAVVIIFGLIFWYLYSVIYVFTIKRIQAKDSNTKKSLGFFEFLGRSFGPGFMLFLAEIIYLVVIAIIMVLISLIFGLIPVVGIILVFIIGILVGIYAFTGSSVLVGEISTEKSFGTALGHAFSKPFQKPKLLWYSFVLGLVASIIAFIAGLLTLIPILGIIIWFFVTIGLAIYVTTMAYYYAKE